MKKENQEMQNENAEAEQTPVETAEEPAKKPAKKTTTRKTTKKTKVAETEQTAEETKETEPEQAQTPSAGAAQVPPAGYPYMYGQVPPAGYPYMYGQVPPAPYPYMQGAPVPPTAPMPVAAENVEKPKTEKKNIFGLISFIGNFVSIFLIYFTLLVEGIIFPLLGLLTLIASNVLSIIGFVKRKNYNKQELSVASFAMNLNLAGIVFLILFYILMFAS